MAVVRCDPCKTEGTRQHPAPEAAMIARVHDDRVHRGARTATVKGR